MVQLSEASTQLELRIERATQAVEVWCDGRLMVLTTRELKAAYRKGIARMRVEEDPLRRHILVQMTYAIKVDLAKRIRFKGRKPSIWKRIVSSIQVVKVLNRPYIANSNGAEAPRIEKED